MNYYWIIDFILAVIVFCDLKTAYYKGFVRMLINIICWIGSLVLSLYASFYLGENYPLQFLMSYAENFESIQYAAWFLICFLSLRGMYHLLNVLIPYSRPKGIFSLANHLLGLAAGLIVVIFNLIIVCFILQTGIIPNGIHILNNTWLYYINQLLPYFWNYAALIFAY